MMGYPPMFFYKPSTLPKQATAISQFTQRSSIAIEEYRYIPVSFNPGGNFRLCGRKASYASSTRINRCTCSG